MAKQNTWYNCEVCGNIVSVVNAGPGELVCCNQPMNELKVQTAMDEGREKHVPVVVIEGNKVTVDVGSEPHPMDPDHHLQVIQIIRDVVVVEGKRVYPGHDPKAVFTLEDTTGIKVRVLCNIHGLWMN